MVYVFHYFDVKGRGEGIRLLLTYVGADFEDKRLSWADRAAHRSEYTYGQTPCLDVNGTKICQTAVIYRYLGAVHNLVPNDPLVAAKVDEIVTSADDVTTAVFGLFPHMGDKAKLKAAYDDAMTNVILPRLRLYDDYLGKQKSGFLSPQVCWADFAFWNFVSMVKFFADPDLSPFPHIKAFVAKLEGLPKVGAWVAKNKDVLATPILAKGFKSLIA